MVAGVVEVCVDAMVLWLPVRVVSGLQLSRHKKVTTVFVFLLGGL